MRLLGIERTADRIVEEICGGLDIAAGLYERAIEDRDGKKLLLLYCKTPESLSSRMANCSRRSLPVIKHLQLPELSPEKWCHAPTPDASAMLVHPILPVLWQKTFLSIDDSIMINPLLFARRTSVAEPAHRKRPWPALIWLYCVGCCVIDGFRIWVHATSAASSLALLRNCPSYQYLAARFLSRTVTVADHAVRPPDCALEEACGAVRGARTYLCGQRRCCRLVLAIVIFGIRLQPVSLGVA